MQETQARKLKLGAFSLTYTVIVIGVVVLANYLSTQYNKSYDTTSEKRFTLADQSTKIIGELKKPVTIYYFDQTKNFAGAKDLLDRYSGQGKNLTVRYVDVEQTPSLARQYGVNSLGRAVAVTGDRVQDIKSITEEDVTGALIRLNKTNAGIICVSQGLEEADVADAGGRSGVGSIANQLKAESYDLRPLQLIEKGDVPSECTVLWMPGPRKDYPASIVANIKKYVEGGGSLLVMLAPPINVKTDSIAANELLVNMLGDWGVKLRKNVIVDTGASRALGTSPLTAAVTNMAPHPITRPFTRRGLSIFPLSRAITIESKLPATASKLLETAESSVATSNLSTPEITLSDAKEKGPFIVAAAGTFNGSGLKREGRFVVVGSADWVNNDIPPQVNNRNLFQNMINWLAGDEQLISIRPHDPADRRLSMTEGQTRLVFWSSVVFLPLMALLAGVSTWLRRR